MNITLSTDELSALGVAIFTSVGVSPEVAREVVGALVDAEIEGISSHGFSRIPFYAAQVKSGKLNGGARPVLSRLAPSLVKVDADGGFALPAITMGLEKLLEDAAMQGIGGLGVTRSHHCGVLGFYAKKIALSGYLGLCFTNTPAAIAPWGGGRACFGTNPIAFGCPKSNGEPVVIDLSLSKVARGKIMIADKKGEQIPEGWALNAQGEPTTIPKEALAGTMLPLGDAKGAALALMVEVLAATLTGANHAYEAGSFFEASGPPPGVGHFFIAINPVTMNPGFADQFERLCQAILEQEGTRLPGARRSAERAKHEKSGISLSKQLHNELLSLKDQYRSR